MRANRLFSRVRGYRARVPLMARGTANHNGDEVELTILGHKIGPTILSAELVERIRELADDLEFETEDPDYD